MKVSQLLKSLGVPSGDSDVIPLSDLRSLQQQLYHDENSDLEFTIQDGVIRFEGWEQQTTSLRDVLENCFDALDQAGVLHPNLGDDFFLGARNSFYFLTNETHSMPSNAGDVVAAGIVLDEVSGDGFVSVSPFLRILTCANGIWASRTEEAIQASSFRKQVTASLEYSQHKLLESFLNSDSVTVEQPVEVSAPVLQDRLLSDGAREELQSRFLQIQDRPVSAFSLCNLITGIHNHYPEDSRLLFQHGGELVSSIVPSEN